MENALYQALKSGTPAAEPVILRKQFVAEIDTTAQDRTIPFTISTASPDRESDTIAVEGWQLDNYRKNPVVLWAHNSWQPPVAKSIELTAGSGKLKSVADFVPADVYPLAETVFQMLKQGFLNATSVGFRPIKWTFNEERGGSSWGAPIDFLEQELLEYSVVPVPANPEALIGAKSAGVDMTPLLGWIEQTLDAYPVSPDERARVEGAWKTLAQRSIHGGVTLPTPTETVTEANEKGAPVPVEKTMDTCSETTCACKSDACTCSDECACVAGMAKALRVSFDKSGRTISAASRKHLEAVREGMNSALDHIKSLLDTDEPDASDIDNEDVPDPNDDNGSGKSADGTVEKTGASDARTPKDFEQLRAMADEAMGRAVRGITGRVE